MRNTIINYLNNFDLDIRKYQDARFMDQKCTPDVVCFIADCLTSIIDDGGEFTVAEIWNSPYFKNNARAIFGKPKADNPKAHSEYDKFIQQPLRMLAYSHILDMEKKGNTNHYKIVNLDILEYIANKERNAYIFLYCYINKVLSDSQLISFFEEYKDKCKNSKVKNTDFRKLRERYVRFIIGWTKINGETEVRRIFNKIINIYAVENDIKGSVKGFMSKYAFTFSDLMYNRVNWRDLNKEKAITRQEAEEQQEIRSQQEAYNTYNVQKAIRLLKKIQVGSEVHDQYSNGEATQVHHIFPKSEFPELATLLENLIKLTATQHYTMAHPNNRTQEINRDYQCTCLLAKSYTIENSLKSFGDKYYRKETFIHVINTGLSSALPTTLSFSDIRIGINQIYNAL